MNVRRVALGCALAAAFLGRSWAASPLMESLHGAAQRGLHATVLHLPDGKTIRVDLAVTPEEREVGLMNRARLPREYGMLFVFPEQQPMEFWMKNTFVDLDMVFLDKDGVATAVYHDVPRSYADTPEDQLARRGGVGLYVLELPAGAARRHKLRVGQRLRFRIPVPVR